MPWLRKVVWCITVYAICWQIYQIFITVFVCKPVRGFWDRSVEAKCYDLRPQVIAAAVQNVVTDIIILCLPIPIVWKLQMATERKLQLVGLFALGSLWVFRHSLMYFPLTFSRKRLHRQYRTCNPSNSAVFDRSKLYDSLLYKLRGSSMADSDFQGLT